MVAIFSENSIEWIYCDFACMIEKLISVPIPPSFHPDALINVLHTYPLRLCFCSPSCALSLAQAFETSSTMLQDKSTKDYPQNDQNECKYSTSIQSNKCLAIVIFDLPARPSTEEDSKYSTDVVERAQLELSRSINQIMPQCIIMRFTEFIAMSDRHYNTREHYQNRIWKKLSFKRRKSQKKENFQFDTKDDRTSRVVTIVFTSGKIKLYTLFIAFFFFCYSLS